MTTTDGSATADTRTLENGTPRKGVHGDVTLSAQARAIIARLGLEPHPEGGWYRRTWASPLTTGEDGYRYAGNGADAAGTSAAGAGAADETGTGPNADADGAGTAGANAAEAGACRPLASLIYFLLPAGDASDWHKVDADEIWLWHGPAPVTLELGGRGERPVAPGDEGAGHGADGDESAGAADADATAIPSGGLGGADVARFTLGSPAADPHAVGHAVVPEGVWQRTVPGTGDALVSCVVSPAFTFDGFELE